MRTRQRTIIVALAATTLLLAACGRSDPGPGAGTGPESEPIADGPATGTITVWAMGTEGEALGAFAEAFTAENPEADVRVTPIPWDAAHERLATAIAADEVPDVAMIGTTWMGEFASTGGLDATPDLIDPSQFFEGAWGSTVVGDTSYGVPWYVETRVLYVSAAPDTPAPADWDELKAMAAGLQDAGATWGINLQPGQTGAWQTFLPFAWQAGAQIVSDDGTQVTLDTPEFVRALEYYQSFFTEGLAPTDLPEGSLEPSFVDGDIGAFVSGPWHLGILADLGDEGYLDTIAVVPMPADQQQASFIGGANLAVFTSSGNRDSAWKFVEWLSQPETQAEWYVATSDLPAVPEAWESGTLATDARLAMFGEQLETAVAAPAIPNWEQIAGVIDTVLEQVAKTGLDPQEAATMMQQQAEAIGTGL